MKTFVKLFTVALLLSFIVGCGGKATEEPAASWLEVNQLGEFFTLDQDWAAIEAAAKEEGKVVVYASSSRIEDQIAIWNEVYPDIVLEGFDMDDIPTKMNEEQNAGNVVGDVWFESSASILLNEYWPEGKILPFVPSEFASVLPTSETQPFAIQRYGGDVWAYNNEQYPDGCPADNWWQMVAGGAWTGKIYIEDPLSAADKMQYFSTIIAHSDEIAAAYKDEYGVEWTTDADYGDDTPTAGWLWVKKFAKNPNLVLMPGGDEVVEAMATLGMTEPAGMAINSYSKMRDTVKGEVAFAACEGMKPVMGTGDYTVLGIANNAPHPNAAKLYIRFALTVEGREPWNVLGNWPGRTDLAAPEGSTPFSNLWPDDVMVYYQIGSQIRDFWTINLLNP